MNFLQFGEFFLFLVTILSFLLQAFLVVGGGGFGFCDFLLLGVDIGVIGFRVFVYLGGMLHMVVAKSHVFPFFSACCSLSCSSRVLAWGSFA